MAESSPPSDDLAAAHDRVTRLAPSPTGALHLGNLRTFLVNWALARREGWSIVLRIEDLDTPRTKPDAARHAIDLLRWVGIDWDLGPFDQTSDRTPYEQAMSVLAARGLAYPCTLSRAQIAAAASAPQEGDPHEERYPPELRPRLVGRTFAPDEPETNWRFATPDRSIAFDDGCAGACAFTPAQSVGDFVLWTKRCQPSYQLAVVVDDAHHRVTHVVRGDDLLDSTARQLLLYEALALTPPRVWCHLPLIVGPDGRRLAKRHGDTRVERYRALGVTPERIVGLLARWSGVDPGPGGSMTAREFMHAFDLRTMPRERVVFTERDEAHLCDTAS